MSGLYLSLCTCMPTLSEQGMTGQHGQHSFARRGAPAALNDPVTESFACHEKCSRVQGRAQQARATFAASYAASSDCLQGVLQRIFLLVGLP